MIVVIHNYRYTAVKTWLFRCQIKRGNVFHTWPHHHHIPFPATIMYNRYIINRRRVLCHHGKASNDVKNREKKQFSEKVRQTGMWLWGMKDNKLNPTLRKDIQWNTMKAKKKKRGLGGRDEQMIELDETIPEHTSDWVVLTNQSSHTPCHHRRYGCFFSG